jgi:hypothetical protein
MPDITEINALLEASKCLDCLKAGQRESVNTYLLALKAGGSLDPQVLLSAARDNGFDKLSMGQRKTVDTYLRWLIAGSP